MASGVFQRAPSTPGVRAPELLTTRKMASGPATERVGEQVDQGFDFIPPALPDRLHDTRLEPTDIAPDLPPVDGVPVGRKAGSRTSRRCRPLTYLLCSPESVGRGSLVREDPREVGPLSGGVMSPGGSTPIRPITGRRSLAPSSFTRRPVGCLLRVAVPLVGRTTGLPRSADVPEVGRAAALRRWCDICAGGVRSPRT